MEFFKEFINVFIHLDKYLSTIVQGYGVWTYLLLFLVVFCETGLVVLPFLPGDSLLFAGGTFAAMGSLNSLVLFFSLVAASILGNTVNYQIGRFIGPKLFEKEKIRFLKKEHLDKAHAFYELHGGKAVIIARFMPIIRTFVPFLAGTSKMTYSKFTLFNVIGAVAWVALFVFGGYFFGNIPVIKKNFSLAMLAIIFISLLPAVLEAVKGKMKKGQAMEN